MKRQVFSLISLLSLLSLLLAADSAIAQRVHVRANVPFNFTVGNKVFSAGGYDIETNSPSSDNALLLRARDGHSSMIVMSNAAQTFKPADKNKLVFDRYGSQYFLAEIWVEGARLGRHLPMSSREKELAKDLAQNARQRVEIVASLY